MTTPATDQLQVALEKPLLQTRCACDGCRKKLALTDMACGKCKTRFCREHRLPELHACTHDFQSEGRAALAAANPRIIAEKLSRV